LPATLVVALIVVAGCGKKAEEGAAGGPTAKADEKVVNVYNWADYIEPSLLEKFTAETGIKVNYDVYDGNEVLETKLMAGNTGYDVGRAVGVVRGAADQGRASSARSTVRRSRTGAILDQDILQRLAQHDPGNQHVVDYMWGTDGIGYNEGKILGLMPNAPVNSWRLVFDPRDRGEIQGLRHLNPGRADGHRSSRARISR
jgi:putrescine transport system substrate-binding protein